MRTVVILVTMAGLGCVGMQPGRCDANDQCLAGEVCDGGECIRLCFSDLECEGDLVCNEQVCVEGQRDTPVIESVDGDGSVICNDTPGHHCVAAGLVVTGLHLDGATFHWTVDSASTVELDLRDGVTNTVAAVDLPVATTAGEYVLTAVNKVGSAGQPLELLQGQDGQDGEAFSPGADELVTLINGATKTVDTARLDVGTTFGTVAAGDHSHPASPGCDTAGTCANVCVGDDCRAAWPDTRHYVRWGATTCDSTSEKLYSGRMWQPQVADGFGGGIVCSTSPTVQMYTNETTQNWRTARTCAVCASPEARICYTKWGDTSCAAGYSRRYSGYVFAGGTGNQKGGGDVVCSSGTRVELSTRIDGRRDWRAAPACAVCCGD